MACFCAIGNVFCARCQRDRCDLRNMILTRSFPDVVKAPAHNYCVPSTNMSRLQRVSHWTPSSLERSLTKKFEIPLLLVFCTYKRMVQAPLFHVWSSAQLSSACRHHCPSIPVHTAHMFALSRRWNPKRPPLPTLHKILRVQF